MKAAVLTAYGQVEWLDMPDPRISDSEVLVEVGCAGQLVPHDQGQGRARMQLALEYVLVRAAGARNPHLAPDL